jgi:hypothetical protein
MIAKFFRGDARRAVERQMSGREKFATHHAGE